MSWIFDAATDIGGRNEQQDRLAVLHAADNQTHLLVVADGAGGHSNGALAARTVVETLDQHLSSGVRGEPLGYLEHICLAAHEAVLGLASAESRPPASTCVMLLVRDGDAYWGHVGDSRLYHIRGERVLFQTADHSLARLFADSMGDGSNAQREMPPANTLYMCLGAQTEVTPETSASLVEPGDSFLLCSDGFWNQVPIEEVIASFSGKDEGRRSAREWVQQAKIRGGEGGDNISLVLARWLPDSSGQGFGRSRSLLTWLRKLLPGGIS